jgi:UV DNA damage repair endonuclease
MSFLTYIMGFFKNFELWKRTTQESFQQSLVEIGSVVSEEKIFLKFHPPYYLICIIGKSSKYFEVNLITHLGVLALFSSNL